MNKWKNGETDTRREQQIQPFQAMQVHNPRQGTATILGQEGPSHVPGERQSRPGGGDQLEEHPQ